MKKVILIIISICLFNLSLAAQERIAVIPFTGLSASEGDTIAHLLISELTKASGNKFDIQLRTQSAKKERGGHDTNADYIVTGHIQKLGNQKLVVASITELETFHQTAGYFSKYSDLNDIKTKLPTMANELINNTINNSRDKPILAVWPFEDLAISASDAEVLVQILACSLANSGKYSIALRTNSAIEMMTEELKAQKRKPTLVDSEYILACSIRKMGTTVSMRVQIIDILTFMLESASLNQCENIEDIIDIIPNISDQLTSQSFL